MLRFESALEYGAKPPYDTWTFVIVPDAVYEKLGQGRPEVRGTVGGVAFRGAIYRAAGVLRMLVRRLVLDQIGASVGDIVQVRLELDPESREVAVPMELAAMFAADSELEELFEGLTPSLRRAWSTCVGGAKRSETRERRAAKASTGIRLRLYPNQ